MALEFMRSFKTYLLVAVIQTVQLTSGQTCTQQECKLPNCYCAGMSGPPGLVTSEIPQIVLFTFDDAINNDIMPYYKRLFPAERLNPNGCPITVTFFNSHQWTIYSMVQDMYKHGHEIASHSVSHRMPQSWWQQANYSEWKKEMAGQRKNIVDNAHIPITEIRGARAPFLSLGSNIQFRMLKDTGFKYDSSFMTGPHEGGGSWPFTLDFPADRRYCDNGNCPNSAFPNFWEFALNRVKGPDGNPCAMLDSCQRQPRDKAEAVKYLTDNFNRYYNGNRAPFGINMHAVWFNTNHHLEAMDEFIKNLLQKDDVYIITVHQMLEWMRDPSPLHRIKVFQPWKTACKPGGTTARPTTTTRRSWTRQPIVGSTRPHCSRSLGGCGGASRITGPYSLLVSFLSLVIVLKL